MGNRVLHPPEGLAVPVDEALLAILVVLNAAPTRTTEIDLAVLSLYCEVAIVEVLLLDYKALGLDFIEELLEVVHVVLALVTSPDEVDSCLAAVGFDLGGDEDVLEEAFGTNGDCRDGTNQGIWVVLH